ncbi:heavy metal-associated isoprenylated plant protein 32-like [Hibiscus syriacus]|uniref:heavy metal-associated isoprenylated plant protein 32-like n=1 Tax=Hibiscus syriacus TaxID=106335 RepID=UPI001922C16F|nr:heavy metal-associated isoprenylated plant protein 32-like [Hibiscus syriacus]
MSKKTVLSVELFCPKCRQNVMKVISDIVGITSIVLDASKNTVTVTGEADPFKIIKKVRKFRKHASIVSIGAAKEEKKEEKKDIVIYSPNTCLRCEVWYVVRDDFYHHCSIL